MKEQLIKPIIRVGNSAGILLPKNWLNGSVKVELIKKPIKIKGDVLEILDPYLEDIIGIYLTGSYSRKEETERSDIDILVITNKTVKNIINGKYNIILISKGKLESNLDNNILPLLPMLIESKAIINKELIKKYLKTPLTKRNLGYYIKTTKSAISVNKSIIMLDNDSEELNCSDAVAYSLILRLRSFYIIDWIINNRNWKGKEFQNVIFNITRSRKAYMGYERVKDGKKGKKDLPINEAEKIIVYLEKGIIKHERWLEKNK
jgi:predicted nucleotidyltransferase